MKILKILFIAGVIPLVFSGCMSHPPVGEGYLYVDSFPQGANLFVNDELQGITPCTVPFSWGGYGFYIIGEVEAFHEMAGQVEIKPHMRMVVIREGYFREERTLRYPKDVIVQEPGNRRRSIPARARVMFYLEPSSPVSTVEKPSTPTVTPTPQQQQQMMGPTIVIGGKILTGEEAVKIVNYGIVKFDSTPQQAEVLIEGNSVGFTPTTLLKFQAGTYNVIITKTGYKPWERKIMVIQDSTITINPQLEKQSPE